MRLEAVFPFETKSEALKEEYRIKKLTKGKKEKMIAGNEHLERIKQSVRERLYEYGIDHVTLELEKSNEIGREREDN